MTTSRDADRILRAWLDLMPDEAPDRTVAAVLQAVETTPQQRSPWRWLILWRARFSVMENVLGLFRAGRRGSRRSRPGAARGGGAGRRPRAARR